MLSSMLSNGTMSGGTSLSRTLCSNLFSSLPTTCHDGTSNLSCTALCTLLSTLLWGLWGLWWLLLNIKCTVLRLML
ncbi:hypothetical protein HHI36_015202 [Cryptolaemus montrouzieri]|uniref:Uncharacterized protein n=1 Tax=Cryptolaemus montrouzieri TaxID=559131 RepID=A0ABD2N506_9CUCU